MNEATGKDRNAEEVKANQKKVEGKAISDSLFYYSCFPSCLSSWSSARGCGAGLTNPQSIINSDDVIYFRRLGNDNVVISSWGIALLWSVYP